VEAKGGRQERGTGLEVWSGRQGERQAAGSHVIWLSSDLPQTFGVTFLFPRCPLFPLFSICMFSLCCVFFHREAGSRNLRCTVIIWFAVTLRIFTRFLRLFRFVSFFRFVCLAFFSKEGDKQSQKLAIPGVLGWNQKKINPPPSRGGC